MATKKGVGRGAAGGLKIQLPAALREADLLSPKHDEILVWLAANVGDLFSEFRRSWGDAAKKKMIASCAREVQEARALLRQAVATKTFKAGEKSESIALTAEQLRYAREHLERLTSFHGLSPNVRAPAAEVYEKRLQVPIHKLKRHGLFDVEFGPLIGFMDFYARLRLYSLAYTSPFTGSFVKGKRVEEQPSWRLAASNRALEPEPCDEYHFYCDVRAEIPSLGELLRQVHFIQEELLHQGRNSIYAVVSPDDKYEDVLIEEGIYFVYYDEG